MMITCYPFALMRLSRRFLLGKLEMSFIFPMITVFSSRFFENPKLRYPKIILTQSTFNFFKCVYMFHIESFIENNLVKVTLEMLPRYYRHINYHRSSLFTRIFGAHSVKPLGGVKVTRIIYIYHSIIRV